MVHQIGGFALEGLLLCCSRYHAAERSFFSALTPRAAVSAAVLCGLTFVSENLSLKAPGQKHCATAEALYWTQHVSFFLFYCVHCLPWHGSAALSLVTGHDLRPFSSWHWCL